MNLTRVFLTALFFLAMNNSLYSMETMNQLFQEYSEKYSPEEIFNACWDEESRVLNLQRFGFNQFPPDLLDFLQNIGKKPKEIYLNHNPFESIQVPSAKTLKEQYGYNNLTIYIPFCCRGTDVNGRINKGACIPVSIIGVRFCICH